MSTRLWVVMIGHLIQRKPFTPGSVPMTCFPVAQVVRNSPAKQEMQVGSLGQEDPLEKGMAAHSSVLVWKIPWMEEPGGSQSIVLPRVGHDWNNLAHM